MTLPRFYPIFDAAHWLELALPLGVRLVQLRVKDRSPAEILALIQARRIGAANHEVGAMRAVLEKGIAAHRQVGEFGGQRAEEAVPTPAGIRQNHSKSSNGVGSCKGLNVRARFFPSAPRTGLTVRSSGR